MPELYPMILDPKLAPAIWGSDALVKQFGKNGDPSEKIGESWECWDTDKVTNGPLAGTTVAGLRQLLGAQLMGDLDASHIFPVLTKIIDAHTSLSVQVHPGDAYAQRVEHQPNGKTECWYVMRAEPGAKLVMGWTRPTDRSEYERRVTDGTLAEILRDVAVKAGEVFYIPAGMLHAIGAGIVIFETQQASDLTYRIFDWNRLGANGKPRPLHVQKAADVLDYQAGTGEGAEVLPYAAEGFARTALVADAHFLVERVTATETPATLGTHARPLILMALEDPLTLSAPGGSGALRPYQTALIPADAHSVSVAAAATAPFMLVTPSLSHEALQKRFADAGVALPAITQFLDQFRTPANA